MQKVIKRTVVRLHFLAQLSARCAAERGEGRCVEAYKGGLFDLAARGGVASIVQKLLSCF